MRLLVDISGLAYRAAHKLHLTDRRGRNTNVSYGVLLSLESLANRLQPEELVICWDRGTPQARIDLAPEYKADRVPKTVVEREFKLDVRRQLDVVEQLLEHLPVIQVWRNGFEADDVIAVLCDFLKLERVGVVTKDRDIYPAVASPRHIIYDPNGTKAELSLTPEQYLTYNVLVGGKNNMKGVPGVGDKGARSLIAEHDTLKAIMSAARREGKLGKLPYEKAKDEVIKHIQVMTPGSVMTEADHRAVVDLYRRQRSGRRHPGPTFNIRSLKQGLGALGFASVLARFKGFTSAFRGLADDNYQGREEEASCPDTDQHSQFSVGGPDEEDEDRSFDQDQGHVQYPVGEEDDQTDGVGRRVRLVRTTREGRRESREDGDALRHTAEPCPVRFVRKTIAGGRTAGYTARGGSSSLLDDEGRRVHGVPRVRSHVRGQKQAAKPRQAGLRGDPASEGKGRGQRTGVRGQSNAARVGDGLQDPRVVNWWRTDKGRRRDTLACIAPIVGEGKWLSRQPTEQVEFLQQVVAKCIEDSKYQPTVAEHAQAEQLHEEWCMERPDRAN